MAHKANSTTFTSERMRGANNPRWNGGTASSNRARVLHRQGFTESEYDALVNAQGGVCGCCGKRTDYPLYADHDHTTGKKRGLLCRECNSGIGFLGDNIQGLLAAICYLVQANG